MNAVPREVAEARELLARTPAVLRAWLAGLSEPWLAADEGEGTYDPVDVVGHLLHAEESDWVPRLEIVLREGESRPFPPFERDAFRTAYAGQPLDTLLDRFAEARRSSLARLDALALGPADLARAGTHPAFGRVTAGQLLATWVTHDLTHLAQVARVLAKRNAEAVGPWRAYLRVLDERPSA